MQDLVVVDGENVYANSKGVAERFGKQHKDVLRAYENMECSNDFRERNFALSSYTSSQNKVLPCVIMTRAGFCFLAMRFTGKEAAKWQEAYINAFDKMEELLKAQNNSVMKKLNEAIGIMEKDKEIASKFGSGLSEWKKVRADHIKNIEKLSAEAQMLLKF